MLGLKLNYVSKSGPRGLVSKINHADVNLLHGYIVLPFAEYDGQLQIYHKSNQSPTVCVNVLEIPHWVESCSMLTYYGKQVFVLAQTRDKWWQLFENAFTAIGMHGLPRINWYISGIHNLDLNWVITSSMDCVIKLQSNLWYKSHQIPKLKCFLPSLVVAFAQYVEARR